MKYMQDRDGQWFCTSLAAADDSAKKTCPGCGATVWVAVCGPIAWTAVLIDEDPMTPMADGEVIRGAPEHRCRKGPMLVIYDDLTKVWDYENA